MGQIDGIFGSARAGGWIGTEWHPELSRGSKKNIRRRAGGVGEAEMKLPWLKIQSHSDKGMEPGRPAAIFKGRAAACEQAKGGFQLIDAAEA